MSNYRPKILMRHSHFSTVYPALFRKVKPVEFERVRIDTPDGDFLDLDFKHVNSNKLVILSHGLEGSSDAVYIRSMSHHLSSKGLDCLAWNARTCSGEMNKTLTMYHSGKSDDLKTVIDFVVSEYNYDEIYLVGFSMGGNLSLKYAGETKQIPTQIKKILAFSTPLSLRSCVDQLNSGFGLIYSKNFLITLNKKVKQKEVELKEFGINLDKVYKSKNLEDFDEYLTAPLHGFNGANDYYNKASSINFLDNITIPTKIVNAKNDPFLGDICYPEIGNQFIETYYPEYGGHVGFYIDKNISYADKIAQDYLIGPLER